MVDSIFITAGNPKNIDFINSLDIVGITIIDKDGYDHFDHYALIVNIVHGNHTITADSKAEKQGCVILRYIKQINIKYLNFFYTCQNLN